ncbi:MAG TPA: AAA family ATPase [Candidatus Polarisedimenticolia bacterium]
MRPARTLSIPSPSLVVMIGIAGSGKTTFCRRHFKASQIVSSDDARAAISGDASDQSVTGSAFALAHARTEERLRRGLLTVFDATSVTPAARRALLRLAERHHLPAVACLLDIPIERCIAQDRVRPGRRVGRAVIARQSQTLAASLPGLSREGFARVHRLGSPDVAARAAVETVPLACDLRHEQGPFDFIGDVHGCARELSELLRRLGYRRSSPRAPFRHPAGRRAVLLGDLVDRGPRVIEAVRIAMRMVDGGAAFCVPGNHEETLLRCLDGAPVKRSPGILKSLQEIEALPKPRRSRFVDGLRNFVGALPPHLVLDGGRLAAAHAGLKAEHVGRDSAEARRFALRGETTGEIDQYGLPVRLHWAASYRGRALVVYGHTPVTAPEWIHNTVNIDTGCVYGGRLTALRYPEQTLVSVRAARRYYQAPRSLPPHVGLRAETRMEPRDDLR